MATILIIEANHNLRTAIVAILELAGYTTRCAHDGPSGIALALEQPPDLILCETTLPQLDGFAVLATLRQNSSTASIPFFIVASHLSKADLRKGLELGASGFLLKPFTENELLRKLETRIDK